MANSSLDPVEVAKVVVGLAVSQQLAGIIGPYVIIFLASVLGSATALANTAAPLPRWTAFRFFGRGVLTAMLLTVPFSALVAQYSDSWEAQWFFIPMAALLSYATDKWKAILGFLGDQAKQLVRNWVNKSDNQANKEKS